MVTDIDTVPPAVIVLGAGWLVIISLSLSRA